MEIDLTKSFEDNLEAAGTTEGSVVKAIFKLDAAKKGAKRRRHGGAGDDGAGTGLAAVSEAPIDMDETPVEKSLTMKERYDLAKAMIISAVAKLARPTAAGALLVTTHLVFTEHLCDAQRANIAKSLSFLPIVGTYSEQCDMAQKQYVQALTLASGIAAKIIWPQIKALATKVEVPEDVIQTVADTIGVKGATAKPAAATESSTEAAAPTRRGRGRKKTRRSVRKHKKTDSKKSRRRH